MTTLCNGELDCARTAVPAEPTVFVSPDAAECDYIRPYAEDTNLELDSEPPAFFVYRLPEGVYGKPGVAKILVVGMRNVFKAFPQPFHGEQAVCCDSKVRHIYSHLLEKTLCRGD